MPKRISIPDAQEPEERRQLAEAISDLHYVCALIVEKPQQLIPGEAVDELQQAWVVSESLFFELVNKLTGTPPPQPIPNLKENGLSGDIGKSKRSLLRRLKDRFFMFWNSEPQTSRRLRRAGEAAVDYLDFGSTVVSSIPGHNQIVELLKLFKQLITVRLKRQL